MIDELVARYPVLEECRESIKKAVDALYNSYCKGGKVLICGNGGSCSDCEHITGELMKGFLGRRPMNSQDRAGFNALFGEIGDDMANKLQYGIPAISLPSQSALLSAFANDVDPSLVYAQLVWGYGRKEDCVIGLTTSGNSDNVVKACMVAKAKGVFSIGLAGKNLCKLDEICDIVIHAPETETYKVQELHLPIYHTICAMLEKKAFEQ